MLVNQVTDRFFIPSFVLVDCAILFLDFSIVNNCLMVFSRLILESRSLSLR